jgi:hypothetical protein
MLNPEQRLVSDDSICLHPISDLLPRRSPLLLAIPLQKSVQLLTLDVPNDYLQLMSVRFTTKRTCLTMAATSLSRVNTVYALVKNMTRMLSS